MRTRLFKFIIALLVCLFADTLLKAQENYTPSADRNYIRTVIPTVANDTIASFSYLDHAIHRIGYYDHLGRPVQEIGYKASPTRKDLIVTHDYDFLGRNGKQWLAIARATGNAGSWTDPSSVAATARTIYQDDVAYSLSVYEESPLNRLIEEQGPGQAWQGSEHSVKHAYRINTATDCCLYLAASNKPEAPQLLQKGMYPANQLTVTATTDEDGHTEYSFTDMQARTVLKRNIAEKDTLDTYYVHDDYGNLCFVLPPTATDRLSASPQQMLDKYAYQYRYDYRNRCTGKKLPGCVWTESIYDRNNRLIFTQDGEQKKRGEWCFHFSDLQGRRVLSGLYHGTPDREAYNTNNVYAAFLPSDAKAIYGYILSYPPTVSQSQFDVKQVNFYDTYMYKDHIKEFTASLDYKEDANYGKQYPDSVAGIQNCKGLLTGRINVVLENSQALYSCFYYDYNRKRVQTRHTTLQNDLITTYKFAHNFSEQLTASCEEYGDTLCLKKNYVYDHLKRLLRETHTLGKETTFFTYAYDETGRKKSLTRTHGNHSETTTYTYNIRNWLTETRNPSFYQTLSYTDGLGTPCYSGNVSSMKWASGGGTVSGYRYSYDELSRLKKAAYGEGDLLNVNSGRRNEEVTAYDKAGNILGLKRYGQTGPGIYGIMDDLSYSYNSNQLQAVNDAATTSVDNPDIEFLDGAKQTVEYSYDGNGNLIQDLNKKITKIKYNCLNLPSQIETGQKGGPIQHFYDLEGRRLRTIQAINQKLVFTTYCGNAIYEDQPVTKSYLPTKNYPFGSAYRGSDSDVQPYKYNGKKLERNNGLDWYDFGARRYDPLLGRFCMVDPLAEESYSVNAYNYCRNEPVGNIDPDGKQVRPVRPPVRRGYRNGGRPNPYVFYPGGVKPQNYARVARYSYTGTGLRETVAMSSQPFLRTVSTPGGNEVQMSSNNILGMRISGGIDLLDSYKGMKENLFNITTIVKYAENGIVQKSTDIVITDPLLALQQIEYEGKAREIEKNLEELNFTGKSLIEILDMLAERKNIIQEKLGMSPKDILWSEFYTNPAKFQAGEPTRITLPELNPK